MNLEALNEPVGEYSLKYLGAKLECGTAADLKRFYTENLGAEPGKIVVGEAAITTTPEVIALLRALLYTGCCRIKERSDACREIFLRACKGGLHLGTDELLATFVQESENPFVPVVQDTMKEILNG